MLTDWQFFKHSGNPSGIQDGDVFSISTDGGERGTFFRYLEGVTAGQLVRYTGGSSGSTPQTKVLFYKGNTYTNKSVDVESGNVVTVPSGVNKLRLDLRNWGGGGTAVWENPQLALVDDPEPEPPTEPDEPEPDPVPDPQPEPEPDPEPEPQPDPTPEPPTGPVYFVATNGNDSVSKEANSIDRPWKTLHLSAAKLSAGDTLYVRGGTYALPVDGEIAIKKSGVTMSAYDNETVMIDGRATFHQALGINSRATNPVGTTEYEPLISVEASGVTLKGLRIRDSGGEGIRIKGLNGTVDNCHVDTSFGPGISFLSGGSGLAKDSSVTRASRKDKGEAFRARLASGPVTFLRCKCSHGGAEGLCSVQSDDVTFLDCEAWDNNKVQVYFEGSRRTRMDGCLIYCTNEIENGGFEYSEGIHIASEIYDNADGRVWVCEDIEVTNTLIVGCGPNLSISGGKHRDRPVDVWGLRNFRFFHNTFVNARANEGILIGNQIPADNNKNNTPSWFVNNIIVQEGNLPIARTFTGTDFSKFVFSHNVWSKQPSPADFYNAATDKLGNAGLSNPPAILESPADMHVRDYKLTGSSAAIAAGTKAYNAASGVSVKVDYFDAPLSSPPDAGFHQFGAVPQPEPDPDPVPDPDPEPEPDPDPIPEPDPVPDPDPQPEPVAASGYRIGTAVVLVIPALADMTAPLFGMQLSVRGEWVDGELHLIIDQLQES